LKKERDWTVLFIGGASGTGKSSIAYELAKYYQVNVMEADDIFQAVEAMTTVATHPAIHYFSTGVNWLDIGAEGNLKWLIDVSKELAPGLKAIVDNHLEADVPVIIEGDFILPEFVDSYKNPKVKALFIIESDKEQIVQNYLAREGGEPQNFRAEVSKLYGEWLSDSCKNLGIRVIESRPWNTAIDRCIHGL